MLRDHRTPREILGRIKLPSDSTSARPGPELVVWRECRICGWEGKTVETEAVETQCPRCQATTERVGVAPLSSDERQETLESTPRRQSWATRIAAKRPPASVRDTKPAVRLPGRKRRTLKENRKTK
jgi:hypothetical protein